MDYTSWVGGPWKIKHAEDESEMAKDDELKFTLDASTPPKIVIEFTCTHSGLHKGGLFQGVACTGSGDTATGKARGTKESFKIVRADDLGTLKSEPTDDETYGSGVCWTAEDGRT